MMRHTVFDTPVVNWLFRQMSKIGLKLTGWKMEGSLPDAPKYVVIAAPHTSNWDFPLTIAMAFVFRIKVFWMGKASLFRGPMGPVMKWLGGIPVDRSRSTNLVQATMDAFNRNRELIIAIPPEGTRSKVRKWKTGFYHIANGAKVPIASGFLDFKRKVGGFGPTFMPTGDIEADMAAIKAFYANITGKHPCAFEQ